MADTVTFYYRLYNFPQNAGRVLVSISQDAATARTVQIGDYAKIITEQSQIIDITRYFSYEYDDIFMNSPRLETDSAHIPSVTIDGTTYTANVVWLQNAPALYDVNNKMRDGWLSDLPYLLVSPNMLFGLTIGNAPAGGMIEFGQDEVENYGDVPDAISYYAKWDNRLGNDLAFYYRTTWEVNDHKIRVVSRPLGLNGVRMAWINRYGCVDFWNFDYCRERNFAVETKKIYTNNFGYVSLGATAETTYTVETRELTQEILSALSQILYSPAVWTIDADGTANEIDIITDECRIFSDTELSTLQLEFRPKKRDL